MKPHIPVSVVAAVLTSCLLAPAAAARTIDPVTNRIYTVVETGTAPNVSYSLSEVDGNDGAKRSLPLPASGFLALNPRTSRIYVVHPGGNEISVVDGGSFLRVSVAAAVSPSGRGALAVDGTNDRLYVANRDTNDLLVLDGGSLGVQFVAVGSEPSAVAFNPSTNRIYVANKGDDTVSILDGATLARVDLAVGSDPSHVSVNPVLNKIYVAGPQRLALAVIDGNDDHVIDFSIDFSDGSVGSPVESYQRPGSVFSSDAGSSIEDVGSAFQLLNGLATSGGDVSIALSPPIANLTFDFGSDVGADFTLSAWGTREDTFSVLYFGSFATTPGIGEGTGHVSIGSNVGLRAITFHEYALGALILDNLRGDLSFGRSFEGVVVDTLANRAYAQDFVNTGIGAGRYIELVAIGPAESVAYRYSVRTMSSDGSGPLTVDAARDLVYWPRRTASGTSLGITVGTQQMSRSEVMDPAALKGVGVNPVTHRVYQPLSGAGAAFDAMDLADLETATLSVGDGPRSIAIDPLLDQLYVANLNDASVTVIDAQDDSTETVAVGEGPTQLAVDPATHRVFVANSVDGTVSVLDGQDLSTQTVTAGSQPSAVVVDPSRSRAYVANFGSGSVTVVEPDLTTQTVPVGSGPAGLAFDPVADRLYVANHLGGTVTVVDGESLSTQTVPVGSAPRDMVVDPSRDQVFVANTGGGTVSVIDGSTLTPQTVAVGASPVNPAFDPLTQRVYVPNLGDATVTVIDAVGLGTETLPVGSGPESALVNPLTNHVYVPCSGDDAVDVIDGFDHSITSVPTGGGPSQGALDPLRNRIFVYNRTGASVTAIRELALRDNPLQTVIYTPGSPVVAGDSVLLSFTAANAQPGAPPIQQVYYQLDSWMGRWQPATPVGSGWTGSTGPVDPGAHVVYAFAADGRDLIASNPLVGEIAAQPLVFVPEPALRVLQLCALAMLALVARASRRAD